MAGSELTLAVANDNYVTSAGATTTPTGGSWNPSTASFRAVVWETEAETDVDNAHLYRAGAIAAWENITVANGDKVILKCTKPSKPYHHISVYQQDLSAWNSASTAYYHTQTITQTGVNEFTITINADDHVSSLTFGSAGSFTVDPVVQLDGEVVEKVYRDYAGNLANRSLVNNRMYNSLETTLDVHSSITAANYKRLLDWINDGTRIRISESADSPTDNSVYIVNYVGKFLNTDLLHTKHKNRKGEITLFFLVESETKES